MSSLYERSPAALEDWREIVEYTLDHYGEAQTEKYMAGLLQCMENMAKNEGYHKDMQIKGRMVRVKHCQKHYIFALLLKNKPMRIIAIFHENMDLISRVKKRL